MSEIRPLAPENFDTLVRIFGDAYPGLKIVSDEDRQRLKQRVLELHEQGPAAQFHGLFREGHLVGIMCLYEFTMNFHQVWVRAGGVGQVAVALTHKKEHVAKEMMLYCLRHFRQQDVPIVALYPFRPDFYRKMGFGYGTKMNEYRVRPSAFPMGPPKVADPGASRVRYLDERDRQAIVDCYQRFAGQTHGMFEKSQREIKRLFSNPQHRLVGYEKDGKIRAYMVFTFDQGETFITNDIHVQELIYETLEALSGLLTFLHTQADQIRYVYIRTQDKDFHHLLLDPRNDSGRLIPDVYHETNTQGVGLMYRVVDVPRILDPLGERSLEQPEIGAQRCAIRLTIEDSFLPENAASVLLRFERSRLQRLHSGTHDVQIHLDIADFSSLLTGTVSFKSLYRYGMAYISNTDYVDIVTRAFSVEREPICMTSF
jgi:predicted acetyltransferase